MKTASALSQGIRASIIRQFDARLGITQYKDLTIKIIKTKIILYIRIISLGYKNVQNFLFEKAVCPGVNFLNH